jgi:hypothetical protein
MPADKGISLRVDHEQSLYNNKNTDFPTRTTIGADYQLSKETQVFAQEELTYGSTANTTATRIGMKSSPWKNGNIATSLVNNLDENSQRTFANVGLSQMMQLTENWAVDGALDHNRTVVNKSGYQFNTNVPLASGGMDFTAVSLGANFKEDKLTWANRLEYRDSDQEDKWGVMTGLVNEQGKDWGWTSKLQLYHSKAPGAVKKMDSDLRLGLVYRPILTRWIVLDRLDLKATDDQSGTTATKSKRIVNNLNLNYKPNRQTQFALIYGTKYVLEKIDDTDYSGYTDLIGFEGRYDLTKEFDIGLNGSLLHSWNAGQYQYRLGPSIGVNVAKNAWISLGYNLIGFTDKDFSAAEYTAQGPFIKFRFKFDQQTVKDGLSWINQ